MSIKLALSGALGKVGKEFLRHFSNQKYKDIALTVACVKGDEVGQTEFSEILKSIKVITASDSLLDYSSDFDVLLDFSTPDSCLEKIVQCSKIKKGVVVGTTGFTIEQLGQIQEISNTIPIIISHNFTWGINFIFELLKKMCSFIPNNYFLELYESHSPDKKDAPSATAKKIIDILKENGIVENILVNKLKTPLNPLDLQVFVSRTNANVNEHSIKIKGPYEEVVIEHKAFSRQVYIANSLKAVKYITTLSKGLYYFERLFENITKIDLQ